MYLKINFKLNSKNVNVMPQNAMTLEQQNEVSKKNWESMSYATLYESMSMYAKSKIPRNI